MVNKPKKIGTAAESAVVRFLVANGWPNAERRTLKGSSDQGDVTGVPGLVFEVKGGNEARTASDGLIAEWLDETATETENAKADYGILVVQRKGIGPKNAGRWWAIMSAGDLFRLHDGDLSGLVGSYYTADMAVRLHLADMCCLLRMAGYGDPLPDPMAEVSR